MRRLRNSILFVLLITSFSVINAQDLSEEGMMSYDEYLGYVKQYHPVLKQAEVSLSQSEAKLLKARGAMDPTLEFSYEDKEFKSTNYWNRFNSTFKVPTILGLDLKVNYEQNTGDFLNPDLTVPEDGLYSAGVSIDLARGLLMNKRMADLKMGKYFIEQTRAEQELVVNNLIYQASMAYLDWVRFYNEEKIYQDYLDNAKQRLDGVILSVELGDKPEIDITEAQIVYKTTKLSLEKVRLDKTKARLNASNFLWFDTLPLEINPTINPENVDKTGLISSLNINGIIDQNSVNEDHPKLKSLDFKSKALEIDYRLKRNLLLPKLEVDYNFLTSQTNDLNEINTGQYKAFVNFKLPVFMRKQRADVKIAKLKINDIDLERSNTRLVLDNKFRAVNEQIKSYETQGDIINDVIKDYERLLSAEARRFEIGESSLFLVNTRERKLVESRIKQNDVTIEFFKSILKLYNIAGII